MDTASPQTIENTDQAASGEDSPGAPFRHPVDWTGPEYYDEQALNRELERVFDICHSCRRCVNLCQSFPTLFDLIDKSSSMEVDGVDKDNYLRVVDHCYLCDLCFLTKCPYVPPHEWNVDFPHLMLRAKAVKFKKGQVRRRDKFLSATNAVGKLATIPVVVRAVNAVIDSPAARKCLDAGFGISAQASLPHYHAATAEKRLARRTRPQTQPVAAGRTSGKTAMFITCYGNYHDPRVVEDLFAVFEHNGIVTEAVSGTDCCGMPKLEIGDLDAVAGMKDANLPLLMDCVARGFDIVMPLPSCALMFRQELPLMFPDDPDVAAVAARVFDPCEYLFLRHKQGALNVDFKAPLGKVVYHVACHQRVQNVGLKTRDLLSLVPDTEIVMVERCSGHDGVYAVRSEMHDAAVKIAAPAARQLKQAEPDCFTSDCMLAGRHIADVAGGEVRVRHPFTLLRGAYAI